MGLKLSFKKKNYLKHYISTQLTPLSSGKYQHSWVQAEKIKKNLSRENKVIALTYNTFEF